MGYRSSASFGKRQEYLVISELLKLNYDVYLTLVDDQGIDCIIRIDEKVYIDVQIKARSNTAIHWNTFANMKIKPRPNYFFIFYTEKDKTFWIIPSKELVKLCYKVKKGDSRGNFTFTLPKRKEGQKAKKFTKFKNNSGFAQLRGFNNSIRLKRKNKKSTTY